MTTLNPQAIDALLARVRNEVEDGHSLNAHVALGYRGEIVANAAFGEATDATRFVIFSATKTIVAMALLPLLADGRLHLTAPVSRYIPEFAGNGKHGVTVLQLLTMQGGFPQCNVSPEGVVSSAARRTSFSEWHLDWSPGTRTEYHPISAHWVISELIATLTGKPFTDVVHELITQPAGVPRLLGFTEPPANVATIRVAGHAPADRSTLVPVFGRADLVPDSTVTPEGLLQLNIPIVQQAGVPGGGAIARAPDIAAVYQSFLHNDAGALPTDWLRDATSVIRNGSINTSDGTPANRSIAAVIAGDDDFRDHRWFPHSPQAFGHHGAGGQLCWADPASGLSLCFLHDTLQQNPAHDFLRSRDINALALACAPT
jgi:CubicO group peptidase (beta-lactamase class C family)